jgi:ferredoxin
MKVFVDEVSCAAHGDCVVAAPEVFDLGDDDDIVSVITPEPGPELFASVQTAADNCPVGAIRIEA